MSTTHTDEKSLTLSGDAMIIIFSHCGIKVRQFNIFNLKAQGYSDTGVSMQGLEKLYIQRPLMENTLHQ
jgi:hypothetical protein